jgi:hypothetical protein
MALVLSVLIVPVGGSAQQSAAPTLYIPAEARASTGPRPVAVSVPQNRLSPSVELGRILGPNSGNGGLLGALIIVALDRTTERLADNATSRAQSRLEPLLAALTDFDANVLAFDSTRSALTSASWLGAGALELQSETGVESLRTRSRSFAQQHPDARQLIFVNWRYQMSPNFADVQVIAQVELVDATRMRTVYRQQLLSIVQLHRPSFIEEENVARWSADGGALARRALSMAFARAGAVLPAMLALDREGFASLTDRRRTDRAVAAGYHGPVLTRDADGPVFWATDGDQRFAAFVAVQTVGN